MPRPELCAGMRPKMIFEFTRQCFSAGLRRRVVLAAASQRAEAAPVAAAGRRGVAAGGPAGVPLPRQADLHAPRRAGRHCRRHRPRRRLHG